MKSRNNSANEKEPIPSLKDKNTLYESNPAMNDDYLFAASACDCTGLAPTVAHDEYEAESYNEIAHYLPPVPPAVMPGMPTTLPGSLPETTPIPAPSTTPRTPETDIALETDLTAKTDAEGIHAEVNTLDKNPFSKQGMEGNHLL